MAKSSKSTSEFEEYFRWIDEIKKETIEILDQREIYREYLRIVENNKKILNPPTFHFWIRRNYAHSVAMGIRRQLDTRRGSISLRRFLQKLRENSTHFTKKRYTNFYMAKLSPGENIDFLQSRASKNFEKFFGRLDFLDKSIVWADEMKLKELRKKISNYADKIVAHQLGANLEKLPTLNDLDESIDELENIVEKYLLLIGGKSYCLVPTHQENWKEVLTRPWIKR